MQKSAKAPTSARASSPATTTASTNTRRRSAKTPSSAAILLWLRRSPSETEPTSAPAPASPRTCPPDRWPWPRPPDHQRRLGHCSKTGSEAEAVVSVACSVGGQPFEIRLLRLPMSCNESQYPLTQHRTRPSFEHLKFELFFRRRHLQILIYLVINILGDLPFQVSSDSRSLRVLRGYGPLPQDR